MTQVSNAAQNMAKASDELRSLVSKFKVDSSQAKLAIVDLAINDHKVWVRKLKEMSDGKVTLKESELKDHHACRLGKWYYDEGLRNYSNNSAFKSLEAVHSKIHAVGNEAVRLCNSHNCEESKKKVAEAEAVSKEVISLLEELRRTAQ